MGKRLVGAILCLSAAIILSSRYIAAAIFMSGISSWNARLFKAGLEYVGMPLFILGVASLILGIVYLVWAEVSEIKKR